VFDPVEREALIGVAVHGALVRGNAIKHAI
jgi:hypothetical protein